MVVVVVVVVISCLLYIQERTDQELLMLREELDAVTKKLKNKQDRYSQTQLSSYRSYVTL